MLLGKRPRPRHPMRRTTSMAGIIPVPVATAAEVDPTDDLAMNPVLYLERDVAHGLEFANLGMVLPRNNYGGGAPSGGVFSGGYESDAAAAHFLETCGLCKRRLFPGRDIYMYRGDTAFCSIECREKMMKQDEGKSRHNHPNPCSRKPGGTDRMN